MTTDLDRALEGMEIAAPSFSGAVGKRCRRHEWELEAEFLPDGHRSRQAMCTRCGVIRDEARAKRGRQSRNYGNRAELAVSRKYGGVKVGHAGGPADVTGKDFHTQVKTHRRLPPTEWRKSFANLAASTDRLPRLLLRFLPGPGLPPDDYLVFRAEDFLAWFGRDE